MTLLEVVVALTVAGIALAAGAAVLGFLTDQQARSGATPLATGTAVRTTLRDWLENARLTTAGDAEFVGSTTRDDGSELRFVTTAPTTVASAGEPGTLVFIHLAHADTGTARALVAELTPWRRPGTATTVTLAPRVAGFSARFLGSIFAGGGWQDHWETSSVLPAAVELRIRASDSTTAAGALLALPLTVSLSRR